MQIESKIAKRRNEKKSRAEKRSAIRFRAKPEAFLPPGNIPHTDLKNMRDSAENKAPKYALRSMTYAELEFQSTDAEHPSLRDSTPGENSIS
jgi:hypothetical protein